MSPPVGIMQKTIFHLKTHSVCKLRKCQTNGGSAVFWQLQPQIMQHPALSWKPKLTNSACPPKEKYVFFIHRKKNYTVKNLQLTEIRNLSSNSGNQTEITDTAFIRYMWCAAGNMKNLWSLVLGLKNQWCANSRKQNIQYFVASPLLTSKACPEIEEDSYWSNPSMNRELITGRFRMHF